jgi:dual specificity phosphatase 12
VIANDAVEMQHAPSASGSDTEGTAANHRNGIQSQPPPTCQTIFLDPHRWLESFGVALPENQEGKLACSKCQAKVGHYVWSGTLCSCGEWISPGFALSKSRIDAISDS